MTESSSNAKFCFSIQPLGLSLRRHTENLRDYYWSLLRLCRSGAHSEMIAFGRHHIAVLGTHGALFFVDYMTNRWLY